MLDTWKEFCDFVESRRGSLLHENTDYKCILDEFAISENGKVDISSVVTNEDVLNKLLDIHSDMKYSTQRMKFWMAVYNQIDDFAEFYLSDQKRWCITESGTQIQTVVVDNSEVDALKSEIANLQSENEKLQSDLKKYKDFHDEWADMVDTIRLARKFDELLKN
jgi:hypothetical protein